LIKIDREGQNVVWIFEGPIYLGRRAKQSEITKKNRHLWMGINHPKAVSRAVLSMPSEARPEILGLKRLQWP